MPEDEASVLVIPMGAVRVVVDARTVETIEDAGAVEGARSDLASWLGLDVRSEVRRALRIESHDTWIVVGESMVVRKLRDDAFRPLPSWLERLGGKLRLSALVVLDDGFAYAMDLDRLFDDEPSEGAFL